MQMYYLVSGYKLVTPKKLNKHEIDADEIRVQQNHPQKTFLLIL